MYPEKTKERRLEVLKKRETNLQKRLHSLPIEDQVTILDDMHHTLESRIVVFERVQKLLKQRAKKEAAKEKLLDRRQ